MKLWRRLFKGLAGVFLVLCVLTVPAWLLSRWLVVVVSHVRTDPPSDAPARLHHLFIRVGDGGIGMTTVTLTPLNAADAVRWAEPAMFPRGISLRSHWVDFHSTRWRWDGSAGVISPQPGYIQITIFDGVKSSSSGMHVFVPYWMMTLVLAILPGVKLMQWRAQRRRVRKGLCPTCGYDLRATPDRCPECGVEVARACGP